MAARFFDSVGVGTRPHSPGPGTSVAFWPRPHFPRPPRAA